MAHNRVKQWISFARVWHLFDAKAQDPTLAGQVLARYILGKHKPIFSIGSDVGDYVVVINSRQIALKDDMWQTYNFFHHTKYAQGATYTPAWQFHQNDPTRIIKISTSNQIRLKPYRAKMLHRLLVFPDEKLPEDIAKNITAQIRPVCPVPKTLDDFTLEDIKNYPVLFDWPKDFTIEQLRGKSDEPEPPVAVKAAKPAK